MRNWAGCNFRKGQGSDFSFALERADPCSLRTPPFPLAPTTSKEEGQGCEDCTHDCGDGRRSPTNGRFVAPLPAEIKTRYSRMGWKKKTAVVIQRRWYP
jgi:hypothetical protein